MKSLFSVEIANQSSGKEKSDLIMVIADSMADAEELVRTDMNDTEFIMNIRTMAQQRNNGKPYKLLIREG